MTQKSQTKRCLRIYEPVFRSCCEVLVGYTFDEAKKWIEKRQHKGEPKMDDFHRFSNGVAFEIKNARGDSSQVLWFPVFQRKSTYIGIVVHEVGHLIFRIFTRKQIPLREENDEVFCYLQEFYVKEILRRL